MCCSSNPNTHPNPPSHQPFTLSTHLIPYLQMYGAFWCSHCNNQKQALGREVYDDHMFQYIECDKVRQETHSLTWIHIHSYIPRQSSIPTIMSVYATRIHILWLTNSLHLTYAHWYPHNTPFTLQHPSKNTLQHTHTTIPTNRKDSISNTQYVHQKRSPDILHGKYKANITLGKRTLMSWKTY